VHPRPLKIAVKDHLQESLRIAVALGQAGHTLSMEGHADVLLIDADPPQFGYRELIDYYKSMGATVLMYPHGGGSATLSHDGLWEPYEHVDGTLVNAPGHAEVFRRMGYPTPTYTIGWTLCETRPFRPRSDVRHVVFGPTHPNAHGFLAERERSRNAEVFAELLKGSWDLTVRYIGTLEQNGLWEAPGVNFVKGGFDLATVQIDAADCVVAGDGTFPGLAVARGVPTVVYGQVPPPMYGLPGEKRVQLRNTERYLDYMRYPYDVEDGPLDEVVHAAARGEASVWRRRFIGEPIDDAAFVSLVERIVRQGPPPVAIEETRGFTIAGFAEELLDRPELLATYAHTFSPSDDATLALWGPSLEGDAVLDMVERAAAAAGVDTDVLGDVLLLGLPGSAEADRCIGERAQAVLSEWPAAVGHIGELPRYGAADAQELRAAAERAWRAEPSLAR
jgi:hypothetical protein